MGVAPDGRTARFLALGMITGDWGGGFSLGMAAQWAAVRAADGRGPQTALRQAVPAFFGVAEPLDVAEGLHFGTIAWDRIAGLAPVVLATADAGDTVARDLVLRLGQELFLLARSSIVRLDLAGMPVPVVLGGGIVAAGNPLLIGAAERLITAEFPAADVRVLRHAPVGGASLIGLDRAERRPRGQAPAARAVRRALGGRRACSVPRLSARRAFADRTARRQEKPPGYCALPLVVQPIQRQAFRQVRV